MSVIYNSLNEFYEVMLNGVTDKIHRFFITKENIAIGELMEMKDKRNPFEVMTTDDFDDAGVVKSLVISLLDLRDRYYNRVLEMKDKRVLNLVDEETKTTYYAEVKLYDLVEDYDLKIVEINDGTNSFYVLAVF
jgi:hypothetical protein